MQRSTLLYIQLEQLQISINHITYLKETIEKPNNTIITVKSVKGEFFPVKYYL